MDIARRIEGALKAALDSVSSADAETPPTLIEATRHAVFPGGGRLRPQLCLSVALACGDRAPAFAEAAAAAIEMLHCASLVHDDLPCFDDAPLRRGLPSVHHAFGEPLAVLAGDQLIVLAFETLARGAEGCPARLPKMIETVARGVGMPRGIIAGQAWESEPRIPVSTYRREKTGALFEAAAAAGALAAGENGSAWRLFGARVGEAYQIADDIQDVVGTSASLGKPVGRDSMLGRPNAATRLGIEGSSRLLEQLVRDAIEAMPPCERPEAVVTWLRYLCEKLSPRSHGYAPLAHDMESGAA
ncbi:MAG: polyprenyl synthetase family protein [Polyangiaceae bacterium]|nr:polyprenyl synthetase family protein [Polyangiaceae bacterium]